MKKSNRSNVDPFIVMDVMEAARKAEQSGKKIVHMEVGQPGTPAPKVANEYIAKELKKRLIDHPQREYWHDKMIWYGPCGIGTSRSLEGFIDMHQLPFRKSFIERDYFKLGHYCEIGDGKFSLCAGWHSLEAYYGSNDWLGFTANNQKLTMRVMDFYHHDEGKIRENWVPIDILHILKQIGIDILEKVKS